MHHVPLCPPQTIKRFIMHAKKTAFIVEHDFIMATYLADRVIVYEGTPSSNAVARTPQTLVTGVFGKRLAVSSHCDARVTCAWQSRACVQLHAVLHYATHLSPAMK